MVLPILAELYISLKEIAKFPLDCRWLFQTKLQQAVEPDPLVGQTHGRHGKTAVDSDGRV